MRNLQVKKIAILFIALGKEAMEMIAPGLTVKELEEIKLAISQLDESDFASVDEVVGEFYGRLLKQDEEGVIQENEFNKQKQDQVLQLLETKDIKLISKIIAEEPLNNATVLLSYLRADRCAEIISELSTGKQAELAVSLAMFAEKEDNRPINVLGKLKFMAQLISKLPEKSQEVFKEALADGAPAFLAQLINRLSSGTRQMTETGVNDNV